MNGIEYCAAIISRKKEEKRFKEGPFDDKTAKKFNQPNQDKEVASQ